MSHDLLFLSLASRSPEQHLIQPVGVRGEVSELRDMDGEEVVAGETGEVSRHDPRSHSGEEGRRGPEPSGVRFAV